MALFGEAFNIEMERICSGVAAALATGSSLLNQLEAVAVLLVTCGRLSDVFGRAD